MTESSLPENLPDKPAEKDVDLATASPETLDKGDAAQTQAHYHQALASVRHALERFGGCNEQEREQLGEDISQLEKMHGKLLSGRVEIVVFGEISTGKSAMINALVGQAVADVDVQGGWTKQVWHVAWDGCGYCIPGLADSQVVLVDTPGLNEVGGASRTQMAEEAARRADLILFVTDSDLNDTEFAALKSLSEIDKPMLVAINKMDLYNPEQRKRLLQVVRDERLRGTVPPENVVSTAADPREVEYIIESPTGSTRSEWRRPAPDVTELKIRILDLLEKDGLALLALNAAMYAADKSDRIASLRVKIRSRLAMQTIWSYAGVKAVAVGVNQIPVADVVGGGAVDVAMVLTLARIYGLEMSWSHARELVTSIAKAAGWMALGELATHAISWTFKALTLGWGSVVTALPQGAAAGYGSYIVGQAARYYFEHGASWGGEAPKAVVSRILDETDKDSVLKHFKEEIKRKLLRNRHAEN